MSIPFVKAAFLALGLSIASCATTPENVSIQHASTPNAELTTARASTSPWREELLFNEHMEFDGRELSTFFFMDAKAQPEYGVLWIDGEVYRLKFDRESQDQWAEGEKLDVLHFTTKFNDGSDLTVLVDRHENKIIKPWYGDWQPMGDEPEIKIPVLDTQQKPSGDRLWLSKQETDFALLEHNQDFYLLGYVEGNVKNPKAKTDSAGTFMVFTSESGKEKPATPMIRVEVHSKTANSQEFYAQLTTFSDGKEKTSAERVYARHKP